jgi:hypothetical protein
MENIWLYIGKLSDDAQLSLEENNARIIEASASPPAILVYFQAMRQEIKLGQRLYWLKNGDLIYVERRHSDDQAILYRHEDGELDGDDDVEYDQQGDVVERFGQDNFNASSFDEELEDDLTEVDEEEALLRASYIQGESLL